MDPLKSAKRQHTDSPSDDESSNDSEDDQQITSNPNKTKYSQSASRKLSKKLCKNIRNTCVTNRKPSTSRKNNNHDSHFVDIDDDSDSGNIMNFTKSTSTVKMTLMPSDVYEKLIENTEKTHREIEKLKFQLKQQRNDIRALIDALHNNINKTINTRSLNWTQEYGVDLPLTSKDDYDRFCELLNNENFRSDFTKSVEFIIDANTTLSRNVLAVIRKLFSRDLAMSFTCKKEVKNKFKMKPSIFYTCIRDVFYTRSIAHTIPECDLSEKQFDDKLGTVLTNSRDWDGTRERRSKNSNANNRCVEVFVKEEDNIDAET